MTTSPFLKRWYSEFPELKLVHDPSCVKAPLIQKIQALSDQDLCDRAIHHHSLAQVARAGMLLAAGGLEEAHVIVQELNVPEACYWHGIVHRREPDWSNAKYWFRRLGHHPVFDELTKKISQENVDQAQDMYPSGEWNPFAFVDLCKESEHSHQPERVDGLLKLQQYEIELLLEYCLGHASR